ncbi:MAG: Flp family type IVb pilin [Xanthobacteraceae bacterium]|jgi:pilus assembly protein Flp/PilA
MFKSSISAICTSLQRFARDEGGATAIEYAMIASGVSIVIAGTVVALGSTVTDMFTSVATALK